jgi:hypothetical protein
MDLEFSAAPHRGFNSSAATLSSESISTGRRKTMGFVGNRPRAIFVVKLVHLAIFLSVAASVLVVFCAGLTNRRSRLATVALAVALGESLIFTANRFRCPLRALAEDLGAESGQVTDIFLPPWFAERIPFIFTPLLAVGIGGMARPCLTKSLSDLFRPNRPFLDH